MRAGPWSKWIDEPRRNEQDAAPLFLNVDPDRVNRAGVVGTFAASGLREERRSHGMDERVEGRKRTLSLLVLYIYKFISYHFNNLQSFFQDCISAWNRSFHSAYSPPGQAARYGYVHHITIQGINQ